jgi:hypothetical protein
LIVEQNTAICHLQAESTALQQKAQLYTGGTVKTKVFIASLLLPALAGCGGHVKNNYAEHGMDWRSAVRVQLPLLGHRNWILVVDKAFPAQNSPGIETINTDVGLIDVLKFALQQIDSSTHVKPIIYCDKELGYITAAQVENIDAFRKELGGALGGNQPQVIPHDSVFVKINEAAKLFKILVLKTNETIPYSSVFIQLDCRYWSGEKEAALRESMK